MSISINLVNPAHYDTNDIDCGISVWMKNKQDKPTNSSFILPNLIVKDKHGQSKNRVIIKLCDGCVISWGGALICHCTSLRILPRHCN